MRHARSLLAIPLLTLGLYGLSATAAPPKGPGRPGHAPTTKPTTAPSPTQHPTTAPHHPPTKGSHTPPTTKPTKPHHPLPPAADDYDDQMSQ